MPSKKYTVQGGRVNNTTMAASVLGRLTDDGKFLNISLMVVPRNDQEGYKTVQAYLRAGEGTPVLLVLLASQTFGRVSYTLCNADTGERISAGVASKERLPLLRFTLSNEMTRSLARVLRAFALGRVRTGTCNLSVAGMQAGADEEQEVNFCRFRNRRGALSVLHKDNDALGRGKAHS